MRRWQDFRFGHAVYLIFVLTLSNFILIFQRLFIERVEFLNGIFSNLWLLVLVFVAVYVPLAILIGAWHRKHQLGIDNEQNLLNNPLMAYNFKMLLNVIEGKATKEEIENYRTWLNTIEDKKKK